MRSANQVHFKIPAVDVYSLVLHVPPKHASYASMLQMQEKRSNFSDLPEKMFLTLNLQVLVAASRGSWFSSIHLQTQHSLYNLEAE